VTVCIYIRERSWYFEKVLCWEGLVVEPSPVEFTKLQSNRPRSEAHDAAVCAEPGERQFTDVTKDRRWTGWSGFECAPCPPAPASSYPARSCPRAFGLLATVGSRYWSRCWGDVRGRGKKVSPSLREGWWDDSKPDS